MTDHKERLHESVRDLEVELGEIDSLDGESRDILKQVVGELQEVLDRDQIKEYEPQSVIDRLETVESEFQASHPTLSGLVMRLVNALGQLGI